MRSHIKGLVLAAALVVTVGGVAFADSPAVFPERNCDGSNKPRCTTTTTGAPSSTTTLIPSTTSVPVSSTTPIASTTTTTASTTAPTTSIAPQLSTSAPPSISGSSTTLPPSGSGVAAVGVGGALPSEATCVSRVVRMTENRPGNATYNATRGSSPNNERPRITGNFVGTTDEILQWAACKWGLNVDWVRAQAVTESWWQQTALGDFGTDPAACAPGHTLGSDGTAGQCPQSIGILQVRYPYHQTAFEDNNAIRSTAYNADYSYGLWRDCFDGQGGGAGYFWLNGVERGRDYAYGDGLGCMGVHNSGRWYDAQAVNYMAVVQNHVNQRTWATANFGPASPA